jgi:hypothetical protein
MSNDLDKHLQEHGRLGVSRQLSSPRVSVSSDVASSATAGEGNPFDENNYSSPSFSHNCVPANITFTASNGRFTVQQDGTYRISATLSVDASSTGDHKARARVSGTQVLLHKLRIHTSVSPASVPIDIIKDLTQGDYITVTMENPGNNVTLLAGCTFNMHKVA